MHQTGAIVLKEFIVFVRSSIPCNDQYSGRPLRSRLQVMGRSVRQRHTSVCNDKLDVQNMEVHLILSTIALRGTR